MKNLESKVTLLDDNLKLCCSRIARSCYCLRNKRNIAHKGNIKTNIYDLKYLFYSAQWILTEVVRQVNGGDVEVIGKIIQYIQIPVLYSVEDFGDRKIIYGNCNIREELLILFHSSYPETIDSEYIKRSMDRRSKSALSTALKKLWKEKAIQKNGNMYSLTLHGYNEAELVLKKLFKT